MSSHHDQCHASSSAGVGDVGLRCTDLGPETCEADSGGLADRLADMLLGAVDFDQCDAAIYDGQPFGEIFGWRGAVDPRRWRAARVCLRQIQSLSLAPRPQPG